MKNYKGIIYAIMSSVAFGLSPIFGKISYAYGSNPTTLLIFRFLIAAVILLGYLVLNKVNMKVTKKQLVTLFFIGFLGYTVTTGTLFMSYTTISAGLGTTLHFIYPALVCAISCFVFKEKISKIKLLSIVIAGLGIYSLIAFQNNKLDLVGVILALTSGVTYSISVIAMSFKTVTPIDSRVSTMYVSFAAAFGMVIYGLFTSTIVLEFNLQVISSYLGVAIISTIFSLILFIKAIELIGPTSTSILATLEPIVSIILGIIIFGESLSFALILGAALIIASTIIIVKEK